jgi:hypothetical protein
VRSTPFIEKIDHNVIVSLASVWIPDIPPSDTLAPKSQRMIQPLCAVIVGLDTELDPGYRRSLRASGPNQNVVHQGTTDPEALMAGVNAHGHVCDMSYPSRGQSLDLTVSNNRVTSFGEGIASAIWESFQTALQTILILHERAEISKLLNNPDTFFNDRTVHFEQAWSVRASNGS